MPSRAKLVSPVGVSILSLVFVQALPGQRVTIKGATPRDVVVAIEKRLVPQQFQLADSSEKNAMFTLDRGMVSQKGSSMVGSVHVTLELRLRFKAKTDSLQVDASEEVVGESGVRSLEFRRKVTTPAEIDVMQRLLNEVRAELEARPAP